MHLCSKPQKVSPFGDRVTAISVSKKFQDECIRGMEWPGVLQEEVTEAKGRKSYGNGQKVHFHYCKLRKAWNCGLLRKGKSAPGLCRERA